MGFFGSKTKTYVYASTFPLAEPNPNEVKDAVLYALISNGSLSDSLINLTLNGMGNKTDQMRSYAKTHYTLGLPSCGYSDAVILNTEDVADAIGQDVGALHGVLVDFNCVDYVSLFYAVAPFLMSARKWDPSNSLIHAYPSGMALPDGLNLVRVDDVSLTADGAMASITYGIHTYRTREVRVQDGSRDGWSNRTETYLAETNTYAEVCPIPQGLPMGRKCCIAGYHLLDASGIPENKRHWWYYDVASGKHPALNVQDSIEEPNNLLPVVPIRYNNQTLVGENAQGELYETGKKMMKRIGVDIDELGASLEENPDIAEIDHAYVMFGISLQTTDNTAIQYLVEFFDHVADRAAVSMMDHVDSQMDEGAAQQNIFSVYGSASPGPGHTVEGSEWVDADGDTIQSTTIGSNHVTTLTEHGLNLSISYSYIQSDIVAGSIGEKGTATMEKTLQPRTRPPRINPFSVPQDTSVLTLKLQITDNAYKRIIVKDLVHRNYVYGYRAVTTTLTDVIEEPEDENFVIPIHYGVASRLPVLLKNQLYTQAVVMVVNSVVHQKVRWYERNFFKMIVMVVAIVIAVWSGQVWVAKLGKAVAAGTAAVMGFLLKTILISVVITVGFEFVAKQIGPELAAIIGLVVAAATIIYNPAGSFQMMGQAIPTSQAVLACSNALIAGAQKQIQHEIDDVTREMEDFTADAEAKMKKLEAAQELLEVEELLPFDLLEAQTQKFIQPPTDSPSQFYDLTIHTGNIGALVLEMIPNYHDIALKLPEPDTPLWA